MIEHNDNLGLSASKTYETENYEPDTTTNRQWEAIRDECVAGEALDDRCNIIAASLGTGKLEVVAKRLACGCILVPADSEEIVL
jgi:hypothetical protein